MQCDFCDAPADIHADRCHSCHASFREECPKCGSLKSIFETCAKCPLELRLEPRVKPRPEWPPGPPQTTGSVVLRPFGILQILLGLWALAEGAGLIALLCLAC